MEMPNASNPITTRNHDLIGMAITHVPTEEGRMIQRFQSTLSDTHMGMLPNLTTHPRDSLLSFILSVIFSAIMNR